MAGLVSCVSFLLSFSVLLGARTVQVDDMDTAIRYSPSRTLSTASCAFRPDNAACEGHWWTETGDTHSMEFNNSVHETFGPATALEFDFRGSSISLYGITLDAGARAFVSVDDSAPLTVSFVDPQGGTQSRRRLFFRDALNPKVDHTLRVAYDPSSYGDSSGNRRWLGIDYLEYSVPDAPADSTTVTTVSKLPASPSTSTADASEPDSAAARSRRLNFVGIIVGSAGAGLVAFVVLPLIWLWWRRSSEPAARLPLHSSPSMRHSAQPATQMFRPV